MKDRVSRALLQLFENSIRELSNGIQSQTIGDLFGMDSEKRRQQNLARLLSIYDRMDRLFAAYSAAETKRQYALGVDVAAETLRLADRTASIDAKTIGIFVKEMLDDFTRGTNGGRKMIGTFFVFSKQGILRENEMTELMAKGWIQQGTGRAGMRMIAERLREKLDSSRITRLSTAEVDGLTAAALDQYRKAGVPPQFMKSFEKMVREEKFLRIINKNGDPMHFRVNHYAELVARTRTGNAQVHGMIEQANAYGVTEFQVTSHNTETEICKPHEGKIYTTDPNNTKFEYMTPARRPLYHILCKHRLIPRAFTKAKLASMPDVRSDAPAGSKTAQEIVAQRDPSEPKSYPFSGSLLGQSSIDPEFLQKSLDRAKDLIGKDVSVEDLARMAGATGKELVEIEPDFLTSEPWRTATMLKETLFIHLPTYNADRHIVRDLHSGLMMVNSGIDLGDVADKGLGIRLFEQQVSNLTAFGFQSILAKCARGLKMNGYYTWARFGFDGQIPASVMKKLPSEWSWMRTIQDVMSQKGGKSWWKKEGDSFDGVFDLSENSLSMQALRDYLGEKR